MGSRPVTGLSEIFIDDNQRADIIIYSWKLTAQLEPGHRISQCFWLESVNLNT